jgi:chaperonin GroES
MTVDVTTLHAPILVRRLEEKETAKGDIITIPDTAKKKPQEVEVLAVEGAQVEEDQRVPLDAKAGDRILLGIQIDDEGCLVIREEEHLATLTGIANAASGNKQVPKQNAPGIKSRIKNKATET